MKIKKTFIVLGAATLLFGSTVVFSEPGAEDDPLVTLSYVTRSIEQIKTYIDTKIDGLSGSGTDSSNELVVVNVSNGQFLIGNSGTEIILRAGKATAVVSDLGGLTDITAGVDLGKNTVIPTNHLLIIPRDDGRGVYCVSDAVFMVRGEYTVR